MFYNCRMCMYNKRRQMAPQCAAAAHHRAPARFVARFLMHVVDSLVRLSLRSRL